MASSAGDLSLDLESNIFPHIGLKKERENFYLFGSLGPNLQSKTGIKIPWLPLSKDMKRTDVEIHSKESPSFNLNKTFYKTSALNEVRWFHWEMPWVVFLAEEGDCAVASSLSHLASLRTQLAEFGVLSKSRNSPFFPLCEANWPLWRLDPCPWTN